MNSVPRAAGYEYEYNFSIKEELVSKYKHRPMRKFTTLIFEIRATFITRPIDGEDVIIDSEVFDGVVQDNRSSDTVNTIVLMQSSLSVRLHEYWMSGVEQRRFEIEALDFARRAAANAADPSPRRVVPIFVDLKVITVQQEGEPVRGAFDRALRAENLVPFFNIPCSYATFTKWPGTPPHLGPNIGSQISRASLCRHAFHSHCFALWLLKGNELCPTCNSVAYSIIPNFDD
ncbi:hypothetical protein MIMGU_mgv1a013130mg [Erythranthe guttata]|uniref:RING-type domain-containing protein n=1 Tax=Erythranthe guttata TaxID=4155 RepID=A0A022RQ65_ERYGU|nr:hypothetical protein MIMGU_mgv1a013130mg [Erythranthe guttata]